MTRNETGLVPDGAAARSEDLARSFRELPLPVVGRVQKGVFLLNMRWLEDAAALLSQLHGLELGRQQP